MPIVRKPVSGSPEESTLVPKELFIDARLSASDKSVYTVIAMLEQKEGEATIEDVERIAQIPRHRVIASLKKLEDTDWIEGVNYAD